MNGQEAFRRLANQIKSTNAGGGPGKGFFAGSGLLIALIGGGIALNASLFNGPFNSSTFHSMYPENLL